MVEPVDVVLTAFNETHHPWLTAACERACIDFIYCLSLVGHNNTLLYPALPGIDGFYLAAVPHIETIVRPTLGCFTTSYIHTYTRPALLD